MNIITIIIIIFLIINIITTIIIIFLIINIRKEPGAIKENFAREMLLFREDTSSISSACATAERMSELAVSTIRVFEEMMALVLKKQQQQLYLQSLSIPRRRWGNVIKRIITQNKVAKMTIFIDDYYKKISEEGFTVSKSSSEKITPWVKDALLDQPFFLEKENNELNQVFEDMDDKGEYIERGGVQLFLPSKVTPIVRRKSLNSPEGLLKSLPVRDNLFSNLGRVTRSVDGNTTTVRTGGREKDKDKEKDKEKESSPRKIAFAGHGELLKSRDKIIRRESYNGTVRSHSNNSTITDPPRKAALPRLSSSALMEMKAASEGSLPLSSSPITRMSPSTLPIIVKTQKESKK